MTEPGTDLYKRYRMINSKVLKKHETHFIENGNLH